MQYCVGAGAAGGVYSSAIVAGYIPSNKPAIAEERWLNLV